MKLPTTKLVSGRARAHDSQSFVDESAVGGSTPMSNKDSGRMINLHGRRTCRFRGAGFFGLTLEGCHIRQGEDEGERSRRLLGSFRGSD